MMANRQNLNSAARLLILLEMLFKKNIWFSVNFFLNLLKRVITGQIPERSTGYFQLTH
jgi:hypothetical protein